MTTSIYIHILDQLYKIKVHLKKKLLKNICHNHTEHIGSTQNEITLD